MVRSVYVQLVGWSGLFKVFYFPHVVVIPATDVIFQLINKVQRVPVNRDPPTVGNRISDRVVEYPPLPHFRIISPRVLIPSVCSYLHNQFQDWRRGSAESIPTV